MDFEIMAPELKAKAMACETGEELIALAKSEGVELTDEMLEGMSGGLDWICSHNSNDGSCPEDVCPSYC